MIKRLGEPIRYLLRNECGGAYTLSYVMVIPILMLLTCVIVETTLMMCAKIGTSYSAYSGARTAIVWSSANSNWSDVEEKIERAAIQSFVPFASGMGKKGSAPNRTSDYISAYESYADKTVSENYVRSKYANAADRLKVTTSGAPNFHGSDIRVTVEYRFRFNIPGIGKLIGEKDNDGYSFPLRSSATLQNEGPKNRQQTMGIGYGKLD
ncbi:MAG: TadE/TadG family type IV pilus assembly protein [Mariniblastus sp.]